MIARFARWHNSLSLRTPSEPARKVGATEGCEADLAIENGQLVVTPAIELEKLDLATLVDAITDENAHDVLDTGAPVGSEFW